MTLTDAMRMLPTPRASDGTKGCPAQRGSKGDLMLPSAVMRLLPTPTTADGTGGHHSRSGTRKSELLLAGIVIRTSTGGRTARQSSAGNES